MIHPLHSAGRPSAAFRDLACCLTLALISLQMIGCRSPKSEPAASPDASIRSTTSFAFTPEARPSPQEIAPVSYSEGSVSPPPPRVRDIDNQPRRPLSLDQAVQLALANSTVIRSLGGRVLTMPETVRTTGDVAILRADPHRGSEAALSAFDTQFESGLTWNGGGRSVNSGFSSGQFGVFESPRTLAKIGVGRVLASGTQVTLGGIGGYDSELAGGLYAAYLGEIRHPLMRGSGREFNQIAGPLATPGVYRGILIAKIEQRKAQLELEQAVQQLIRDVSATYWELYFAYEQLQTKQTALENARQTWELEKQRVAAHAAPADHEAMARQQYYAAQAAVLNAIGGTGRHAKGVYDVELRLRLLLALDPSDGQLIVPDTAPLAAEFRFDWDETMLLAHTHRVELRRQQQIIEQRKLEIKAAKNLRKPQVDVVGAYRRLADDPAGQSELFTEALDGWRLGIEYRRAVGNRRENAAVRSAQLRLRRDYALLEEQRRRVSGEVRTAFTELDRAFGVMQALRASRDAAHIRLQAEAERHAAGDTHIERVLESQIQATQAETAYQRSLVDYNLAFLQVNHARGTLFQTMGIGFASPSGDHYRFTQVEPSAFAAPNEAIAEDATPRLSR